MGSGSYNLALGSTVITVTGIAQDGSQKDYTITVNRAAPSANNKLTNLTLNGGGSDLIFEQGAFDPETTFYTATVSIALVPSVIVAAEPEDSGASMTITPSPPPISLVLGLNPIFIEVSAQNGSTKTYVVVINCLP
jgi:hypothetical protein